MKKLFVLASLLTVGALSANAQTGTTTTTTRQTTTSPSTMNSDQTTPSTTTTESTTTSNDQSTGVSAKTKNGKTMIVPADGAKVKGNGKKVKVK